MRKNHNFNNNDNLNSLSHHIHLEPSLSGKTGQVRASESSLRCYVSSTSSPVLLGKKVIQSNTSRTSLDSIPALPLTPRKVLGMVSGSPLGLSSLIFKLRNNINTGLPKWCSW